jgi:hypothetical protein
MYKYSPPSIDRQSSLHSHLFQQVMNNSTLYSLFSACQFLNTHPFLWRPVMCVNTIHSRKQVNVLFSLWRQTQTLNFLSRVVIYLKYRNQSSSPLLIQRPPFILSRAQESQEFQNLWSSKELPQSLSRKQRP